MSLPADSDPRVSRPNVISSEAKRDALHFLERSQIVPQLEQLVNEMARIRPPDCFGYMVKRMTDKAPPPRPETFSWRKTPCSVQGHVSLEMSVHGTHHAKSKLLATTQFYLPVTGPTAFSKEYIEDFLNQANTGFSKVSNELNVTQEQMDSLLPDDGTPLGKLLASKCSLLCMKAGTHCPAAAPENLPKRKTVTPLPSLVVRTVVCGPRFASGKLRIGSYSLVTMPELPLAESIEVITAVTTCLKDSLTKKGGATAAILQDSANYVASFDRVDYGWDVLNAAVDSAKAVLGRPIAFGKDLAIAVDCDAEVMYDESKQKYELVAGLARTREELLSDYLAMFSSHPEMKLLINPFRKEDAEMGKLLNDKMKGNCKVLFTYPGCPQFTVLQSENYTVTALLKSMFEKVKNNELAVLQLPALDAEAHLMDLALSSCASHILLTGLGRDRTAQLQRLDEKLS